jgi:hypothetical protein
LNLSTTRQKQGIIEIESGWGSEILLLQLIQYARVFEHTLGEFSNGGEYLMKEHEIEMNDYIELHNLPASMYF